MTSFPNARISGPAKLRQVDHESAANNHRACPLQQFDGGERRAAGRNQIIHHDDTIAGRNRIAVDFHAVAAIFELVLFADHRVRQLSFLAHGNEAARQLMRHRAAQDEASRLNAGDLVHLHAGIGLHQLIHGPAEGAGVSQKRRDVPEDDAGFGIVRDGADDSGEIHACFLYPKLLMGSGRQSCPTG